MHMNAYGKKQHHFREKTTLHPELEHRLAVPLTCQLSPVALDLGEYWASLPVLCRSRCYGSSAHNLPAARGVTSGPAPSKSFISIGMQKCVSRVVG